MRKDSLRDPKLQPQGWQPGKQEQPRCQWIKLCQYVQWEQDLRYHNRLQQQLCLRRPKRLLLRKNNNHNLPQAV